MISRFKGDIRWEIKDKVVLQLFFKITNILMAQKHVEVLIERRNSRVQIFGSQNSTPQLEKGR